MPRVQRNYQHKDFSYLLQTQENKRKNPVEMDAAKVPEVSEAKRRRDSLLANKNLKYVTTKSGSIHDRDCATVAKIPDESFDMCSDFPNGKAVCFICCRRAMVRKGLRPDQMKYVTAVLGIFDRLDATNSDINRLFIIHNATVEKVERDSLCLKVNDDRWIIQIANGKCLLFHNNYYTVNENERLLNNEFHLQIDAPTTIRNAITTMCQYTWENHLRHIEERKKAMQKDKLTQSLKEIRNLCRIPGVSLFHKHYRILNRDNKAQEIIEKNKLPVRIKKEKDIPNTACSVVWCSVPCWKESCICFLTESIKTYCIEHLYTDYLKCCQREFGLTSEGLHETGAN